MNNIDWSQFTVLDHMVAMALILGWVLLTGLLVTLGVNLGLRVFSLVVERRSGNRSP